MDPELKSLLTTLLEKVERIEGTRAGHPCAGKP